MKKMGVTDFVSEITRVKTSLILKNWRLIHHGLWSFTASSTDFLILFLSAKSDWETGREQDWKGARGSCQRFIFAWATGEEAWSFKLKI